MISPNEKVESDLLSRLLRRENPADDDAQLKKFERFDGLAPHRRPGLRMASYSQHLVVKNRFTDAYGDYWVNSLKARTN